MRGPPHGTSIRVVTYETRELGVETWPDFERVFAPGTGWAFCACMLYQRGCHLDGRVYTNREQMRVQNQIDKRALVRSGRAHGVLVYTGDEPVGWCQFGPAEELPLPGVTRLDRRIPPLQPDVRWRITCFVTAVRHRHRGAARVALRAAVRGIAERGGGVVEAYPTTRPQDGNWRHAGTVAMFEREGFTVHERPSAPYVVVRRTVAASAPPG